MPQTKNPQFRKNLLAIAACAALTPQGVWALTLAQSPPLPTAKSSFIAPNVIISVDDSGSMDYCLNAESSSRCIGTIDNTYRRGKGTRNNPYECNSPARLDASGVNCVIWQGATDETAPINGVWPPTSRRMNVLKHSLTEVFSDKKIVDENKIRLGWQALHNNGGFSGATSINSSTIKANSIRRIDANNSNTGKSHRDSFMDFVSTLKSNSGTPAEKMFSQADAYMRRSLTKDGPWANNPGGTAAENTEYLGCRRNYHIMMTDGRWNTSESGGNQDGITTTLGDGKNTYDITSDQTQVYRDSDPDNLADWAFKSWAVPLQSSGLKDADKLKRPATYDEAPATETFVSTDKSKTTILNKFWNPKYNPATWPHMVTYTIGFSEAAITWPYSGSIKAPTAKAPFGYDGSFPDLVTGKSTWPTLSVGDDSQDNDHALDLWHAAINGRGRFYAISEGKDLANAFREIIGKINEESAPLPSTITGGGASSGYSVAQSNVGTFVSVYSPKQAWKGWLQASPVTEPVEVPCPTPTQPTKTCTKFADPTTGWDKKTTAYRLDERSRTNILSTRVILSWSDKWETSKIKGGVPFKWADDDSNLSTAQKSLLGVESNTIGAKIKEKGINVLNYIRGDRDLEGVDPKDYTDDKPFRQRQSRQGDIVNSEIWYTGAPSGNYSLSGYGAFASTYKDRTPMLYVGGNDGMLHGFSAVDGEEKIAYVPRGVIGNLKKLSEPNYVHQYFVDGSPMTGDVKLSGGWATMLVGTLGAGGKGYFILDVTDPSSFSSALPTTLVKRDRTRGNSESEPNCGAITDVAQKAACTTAVEQDKDIGNILASPVRDANNLQQSTQITRMNNDRWAVVMGNGYNSANQRPVLLVQYLDGSGAEEMRLKTIPATADAAGSGKANDNGLSAPALVDLNGDGRTDVVYAGDNLGNLWKFDLTSEDDSKWDVAGWGASLADKAPLFTAQGPVALGGTRNQIQPITAPPIVRANDRQKTLSNGDTVAVGGLMVAFGTGRNVTENDRKTDVTQNVQTLYSVLDNTRYRVVGAKKDRLAVHEGGGTCPGNNCIPVPTALGTGVTAAKLAKQSIKIVSGKYSTVEATEELKTSTWAGFNGWYMDLPEPGERLLKPMQFFDGSNILAVYSESPSGTRSAGGGGAVNESCSPETVSTAAGVQYRNLVNIMDGKIPSVQLVDMNGDNIYNAADKNVSRTLVNTGSPLLVSKGKRILDLTGASNDKSAEKLNRMPEQSMRPSWRQLK